MIQFKGYAYGYEDSDISGKRWLRYDPSQPVNWEVPLFDHLAVAQTAQAPRGGYLVSAAHAGWLQEKLRLHGFEFQSLTRAHEGVEVEVFRAGQVHIQSSSYEGRVGASLEGGWSRERRDLPAGSLYVPAAQRGRRLLVHLFEPAGSDSFVSWGFFHNAFERKEYMEDYVAEAVAREMLERDPGLAEEFWRCVEQDEGFAGDPGQRLEFFKRRHPSWDERFNLYPVFRLDGPLA